MEQHIIVLLVTTEKPVKDLAVKVYQSSGMLGDIHSSELLDTLQLDGLRDKHRSVGTENLANGSVAVTTTFVPTQL